MEKNYSRSEILKFLYGELDPETEKDFIEALYSNEDLFKEFESLEEAKAALNGVELELQPSDASLDAIMKHVKTTRPRTTTKRRLIGIFTGEKIPGFRFLTIAAMITVSLITVGIFVTAFQAANAPQPSDPARVLSWEAPAIHDRIQMVRMNLDNMSGQRELPRHLYKDTYQIVNTAHFDPQPSNVVLVNLKK